MESKQPTRPMSWGEKLARENRTLKEKIGTLKAEAAALQRDLKNTWQLVETLPGALLLVEKKQILFANQSACEALGYEKEELTGKPLANLTPSDFAAFSEIFSGKNGSNGGAHTPCEATFLKKNGDRMLCAAGVRAIRKNRKKAFLVNLLEIEKLQEKERRAGVSRNMDSMKRIIGVFDKEMQALVLLFEKPAEGPQKNSMGSKQQRMFPEKIAQIRTLCASLEKELRLIGRPDYGAAERGPFDLHAVILEAERAARISGSHPADSATHGPEFKNFLQTAFPLWGVEGEMREAFSAILQNAMEAVDPFGEIYVTFEEDAGHAFVYVQDNGAGIQKDAAEKLYEPFFTTKKAPHRGLGLSVAYSVVARHGGKINIISREGQGTTVAVKLPIGEKGRLTQTRARKNRIRDLKALLISSENSAIDLLRLLFADRGGQMTIVSGEKEAVKELGKGVYDLLILNPDKRPDMMLGAIKRIRKAKPNLAIVLVHADRRIPDQPVWKDLGVDCIEGRPLNMDAFFVRVSEILAGKDAR